MKFISWNVNGLRAAIRKGFMDAFVDLNADFFCLQEIKLSEGQVEFEFPGYFQYYNYAEKKGYSGTAVFTKYKPLSVTCGIGIEKFDREGRAITLEMEDFYLVNAYSPNSRKGLIRLDYREEWEDAFLPYLKGLDAKKPVILCGDLNVAHEEKDLKDPEANRRNAGFSDEERTKFQRLLDAGFVDSYRYFYPDAENEYTWWSYWSNAREKNNGWRIDYFVVSERLADRMEDAGIYQDIYGSDHCPVELILK